MSQSDTVKVLDLIRAPLADPYRHIKEFLLKMHALTDYARYEAISSLPLSGDMLPSALMLKMLALFPADHQACFFLCGAFLKHLPPDVRAHLVHDRTSDSLSLALSANKIYQSQVSSALALNYVSSNPDDWPLLAVCAPPASRHHFPALTYSWSSPPPFPDSIFSLPLLRFIFSLLVSPESC